MSCTENDNGPFVVFFLPALVGCLTILLARRWANSQVSGTSSTAVSRRRKIIKDPLVKRPLPPIACKMTPLGSKKPTGIAKKGTLQITDEDAPGGGKRVGRPIRLSPPSSNGIAMTDVKITDGPMPPKHIPFPYIPQDGELLFEVMTFVFTIVATGLQFLNLYRTVWWLPQSYTNQAMNFYLIDPHLVAFIVTILSRRLLLALSLAVLRCVVAPKLMPHATAAARMFIFGVVLGSLAWCTYFIALKYPLTKMFYLCYPALVYLALFGVRLSPLLEAGAAGAAGEARPPLHCCAHEPRHVRAEVDSLRDDFNARLKRIIFDSVVGAYYSSLVPCCFAQSYLYYDVYGASQQVAFVCGGLCGRYASQLLSAAHCDVPHRAARHLGSWRREPPGASVGAGPGAPAGDPPPPQPWAEGRPWARGARVQHAGAVYVCAAAGVAVPGDHRHHRFYAVFADPSSLLCAQVCLQLALVMVQLCVLFSSMPWHNFLSTLILLFVNYYTLFKMVRDYLIAWKVYRAEQMIHERNNAAAAASAGCN